MINQQIQSASLQEIWCEGVHAETRQCRDFKAAVPAVLHLPNYRDIMSCSYQPSALGIYPTYNQLWCWLDIVYSMLDLKGTLFLDDPNGSENKSVSKFNEKFVPRRWGYWTGVRFTVPSLVLCLSNCGDFLGVTTSTRMRSDLVAMVRCGAEQNGAPIYIPDSKCHKLKAIQYTMIYYVYPDPFIETEEPHRRYDFHWFPST